MRRRSVVFNELTKTIYDERKKTFRKGTEENKENEEKKNTL